MSKRPSPTAHAADYKNKIKNGNDDKQYISLPDKNGVYHWKRIAMKNSAFEYYAQMPKMVKLSHDYEEVRNTLKKVSIELKKHNIYLFEIGWYMVWDYIDYAWDDAIEKVEKYAHVQKIMKMQKGSPIVHDYASFIFYTNHNLYWAAVNGELNLQYNFCSKDDKKITSDVLTKYFKDRVKIPRTARSTINIKLRKKK